MHSESYKYYLQRLNQLNQPSQIQKLSFLFVIAVLLIVGFATSFVYYVYAKESPIRHNYQHLQALNSGYLSTKQSLKEILTSLQVAGTKVEVVESSKETSSGASGFFTSLDDTERIILKLESAKKNIDSQKANLSKQPHQFEDLTAQLLSYYRQSASFLENISKEQKFAKEILIASGPRFYLPSLADEDLWEKATKDEIKIYYENIKLEADSILANLAKILIPYQFQDFYNTQMSYLDLIIKVSDSIVNTLSEQEGQNKDEATQIEKAYGQLVAVNDANQELSQKLLREKLKIYDSKNNLSRFSQVLLAQNSLDFQITSVYSSYKHPKSSYIFDIILDLQLDQKIGRIVKVI